MVKVTERGVNSQSPISNTLMQSLTFIIFIVSQKMATLTFLQYQIVGWPNADHCMK